MLKREEQARTTAGRPYPRVSSSEYSRLVQRVQELASTNLPRDAIVLVASKGDEALLDLGQRRGWHFPQDSTGKYAGHYPEDGLAVVSHLRDLAELGARYIVFPGTSLWWLDYYPELQQHLDRGRLLVEQDECHVFELPQGVGGDSERQPTAVVTKLNGADALCELVSCLLPPGAAIAALGPDGERLLDLEQQGYEVHAIDSVDASASLRRLGKLEARDSRFVVLTAPAEGWLDSAQDLRRHVRSDYALVTRQQELCEIYERGPRASLWARLRSRLSGRAGAPEETAERDRP
jgi:hypothetical protein